MLDRLDAEFAFGRQALDVRAYRQELLSSNIANADTPGYKARDVDFASALAGALKKSGGTTAQGASNTAPLAMAQPAGVTSGVSIGGICPARHGLPRPVARPTTTAGWHTACRPNRRLTVTRSISMPSACSSRTTRCTSNRA